MKKKLRGQIKALAQQLMEGEKTFNTSRIKEVVSDIYDRLTILEYLETQIDKPESEPLESSLDSKSFREENWFTEPEPVPQPQHKEDLIEPLMEKIKDIVAQMPEESNRIDEMLDQMLPESPQPVPEKPKPGPKDHSNELEEFASTYQQMPEFERKQGGNFPQSTAGQKASKSVSESHLRSLNDTVNKGLNIGLNDRLAFIKHLFEGQTEDYTRVLSQINTMQSFEEARDFIQNQVRPDYNNWQDKENYSERFMNLIEKSF